MRKTVTGDLESRSSVTRVVHRGLMGIVVTAPRLPPRTDQNGDDSSRALQSPVREDRALHGLCRLSLRLRQHMRVDLVRGTDVGVAETVPHRMLWHAAVGTDCR